MMLSSWALKTKRISTQLRQSKATSLRLEVTPKRHLAEFNNFEKEYKLGDVISAEIFNDVAYVDVIGNSKGKGFSGRGEASRLWRCGRRRTRSKNRLSGSIGANALPC